MRCSVLVTEGRYKMRVLGDTERHQKRKPERCPVICFIVLVVGFITRGSRGPTVTVTVDMKAWEYWCASLCV